MKKVINEKEVLNCKECSYKCKKEISLKKHMLNNHEEHMCKECEEKLPTFMELLKHFAKHHFQDKDEEPKLNSEEDKLLDNLLLKDLEEKEEYAKDSSFVFRESMLDEFLDA